MSNCTTFLDVNRRFGDKTAIVQPTTGHSYSYRELFATVNRVGNGLRKIGIGPGERICIHLDSSPDYVICYLAIWRIGAVAVPVNIALTEEEVRYAVTNAGAAAIITDAGGCGAAERIRGRAPSVRHIVCTGTGGSAGTVPWDAILAAPPELRAAFCAGDTVCQLQYTSGTTGNPKGAMLTHANWMAALDAGGEVLGLCSDDVYLGIYPMAHVGVSWGISALKAGATWVVMERFDPEAYIRLVPESGATVVASMPPVIHSLSLSPPGTEEAFAGTRIMISGGGPLHPSIWKTFHERFGIPVANAYGLSETIVVGTGTAIRPEDYATAEDFRSVGHPVGYSEVTIVDTDDPTIELPPGETGEIALRGPSVASGYWQMPDETNAVFLPEGWFLTGDIGYLDSSGMLAITDRKKDMIVMSGWKVYPTEVEKVLMEHPKIRDIAVFGIPDEHRGEIPVAAVVPAAGVEFLHEELVEYARERLAGYKIPRRTVILRDLPRVGGWKLLRRELRDRFGAISRRE
ncbi:MAG: acyl-CoA synthetase [Methanoculleus sp. SDB]|nr:MAG: acyl-CoA synthetase [Methanoculleus sp. SDB]